MTRGVVVGACLLGLESCVVGSYGTLKKDDMVTHSLEQGIQSGLKFYVAGGSTPAAVVGIDTRYQFDPGMYWTEVKEGGLAGVIADVRGSAPSASGGKMLGKDGKEVGVFYAAGQLSVQVDGKNVTISLPPGSGGAGGGGGGGSGGN